MHRAVDATDLNIIWPGPSSSNNSFIQIRDELSKNTAKSLNGNTPSNTASPKNSHPSQTGNVEKIKKWMDGEVEKNASQARAVEAVTFKQNKHVPFLLFGSFGTGKTKTMVINYY